MSHEQTERAKQKNVQKALDNHGQPRVVAKGTVPDSEHIQTLPKHAEVFGPVRLDVNAADVERIGKLNPSARRLALRNMLATKADTERRNAQLLVGLHGLKLEEPE